jgi:hypothetical protein
MDRQEIAKALNDVLFDSVIVRHGFVPYLRDYDVVIQISRSQLLFRFSHCVSASVTTSVGDELWQDSWNDTFTSEEAYEKEGRPEGYFWGVGYSMAYPGPSLLADSLPAREWSLRLGKQMIEVLIETNAHNIRLIFHDLYVTNLPDVNPRAINGGPSR